MLITKDTLKDIIKGLLPRDAISEPFCIVRENLHSHIRDSGSVRFWKFFTEPTDSGMIRLSQEEARELIKIYNLKAVLEDPYLGAVYDTPDRRYRRRYTKADVHINN